MPRQANTRTPSSSRSPPGRGTNCGSVARQPGSSQLAATCQQPIRGEHCGHVTGQRPVIGPPASAPRPASVWCRRGSRWGTRARTRTCTVLCFNYRFVFHQITSFMKRHTSPNLQCLLSTYHPIPVFLAGKVWVDGHELQGAVVLVLRHGGQQLGLEVVANQMGGLGSRDHMPRCDWSPGGRRWCWPRASRGPRCPWQGSAGGRRPGPPCPRGSAAAGQHRSAMFHEARSVKYKIIKRRHLIDGGFWDCQLQYNL